MWSELWAAIALVMVLEGILPFLSPDTARRAFTMLARQDSQVLRFGGLACMLSGVLLLYLVH